MRNSDFLLKLISVWDLLSEKNQGKQVVLNNYFLVLIVAYWVSCFVINVTCTKINAVNLNLILVICKDLTATVCNKLGVVQSKEHFTSITETYLAEAIACHY